MKTCLPDVFFTTVSYPIKSTPYYEEVAPRLVGIENWARTTDREFKVAGRHSRRYYQYADQLLKSEVARAANRTPAAIRSNRRGEDFARPFTKWKHDADLPSLRDAGGGARPSL